jgi:uncharacterized protein
MAVNKSSQFGNLVMQKISRRGALKLTAYLGAAAAAAPALSANAAISNLGGFVPSINGKAIVPMAPSSEDALIVSQGYKYNVIRKMGDPLGGGLIYGENNDYTAYFPIDLLNGGNNSKDGLLWVNHEYFNPTFISGRLGTIAPTTAQEEAERNAVGGSIIHVRQNAAGEWEFVDDPMYTRRVTGLTKIRLDGPAAGSPEIGGVSEVIGSVGNCGGGYTPWGTALSGEENFQDYATDPARGGYGWKNFNDKHQGWIVEIDPFNKDAAPVKHTALGRFQHEGATVTLSKDNRAVVYTGHDRNDECVYKFVSKGTYNPGDRAANLRLLSEGTLYVADFANGKWLPVDIEQQPKLKEKYKTQAEVLIDTAAAGKLIGGTPTDRPEDIKIHPKDKSVFIAFTNNTSHGNFHGHIGRIFEKDQDAAAVEFTWEVFATGGPQKFGGFSSPDNLLFDKDANLLVLTDISSSRAGKGIYKFAGNNGVWVIPTEGEKAGIAYQFLSGPVEAEVTGGTFTPDFKTMFMSVQHPGEESKDLVKFTSAWPSGKAGDMPRSSVVAITGW